jgi:hypothetical protein
MMIDRCSKILKFSARHRGRPALQDVGSTQSPIHFRKRARAEEGQERRQALP